MEKNTIEKLESNLMEFVNRVVNSKSATETEVQILPQVAQVLVEISKLPCLNSQKGR